MTEAGRVYGAGTPTKTSCKPRTVGVKNSWLSAVTLQLKLLLLKRTIDVQERDELPEVTRETPAKLLPTLAPTIVSVERQGTGNLDVTVREGGGKAAAEMLTLGNVPFGCTVTVHGNPNHKNELSGVQLAVILVPLASTVKFEQLGASTGQVAERVSREKVRGKREATMGPRF